MKLLNSIFAAIFALPSLASAAIVTVDLNQSLPHNGYTMYSVDGDGTSDIGLSEDCCDPNNTFVNGSETPTTEWQFSWLTIGQSVDSSLNWVSNTSGYTPTAPLLPGLNYLAVRNTSIGNYFGYITIDFELPTVDTGGYSQTLLSYTYDNTGAAITVASTAAAVPEPTSLALLGIGMIGVFGAAHRKLANV